MKIIHRKLLSYSIMPTLVSVFAFSAISAEQPLLERGKSVFERKRSDYDSDGVRLGSFYLKPSMDIEYKYDDNIFATQNNETDDNITTLKPGLGLESNWNRHSLSVYGNGEFGIYTENDRENYNDYNFGFLTRFDPMRETYITAGLDYAQEHEDRGSAGDVTNAAEPTEYDVLTTRVGFTRGLRKISLRLDGQLKQYDYDDSFTASGTELDNDDRDRDELSGSLRIGYELAPEYEAFVKLGLVNKDYDVNTDGRDSDGYDVTAGTALDLSGKLKGQVYAGYFSREYDGANLNDIDDVNFGANLLWNVTSLTSVKPSIIRSVKETTTANSSGYIATRYRVGVEHELKKNILLDARTSLTTNEYEGGSPEREDDITEAYAGVKFLVNRKASLKLNYHYQERDSNIANQDYQRNKLLLSLNVKL